MEAASRQQATIEKAIYDGNKNPQKRRKLCEEDINYSLINADAFENVYVQFLASSNTAIRLVENEQFRALVAFGNPNINTCLGHRENTTKWVFRQYEIRKKEQIQRLQSALSDIHLMIDCWTSTNHRALLGITAVYVAEDGHQEKCVLGIKSVKGRHSGANLASYVTEVISD